MDVYACVCECVCVRARVDMFVRVRDRVYAYVCVYELCGVYAEVFVWNNFDVQNVSCT